MSALVRQTDEAARALAAERVRSAGRARRAEAAGVAQMARSLIRDARAAGAVPAAARAGDGRQTCSPGAVGAPGRSTGAPLLARRRRPRGGSPRLAPAPVALRRA